MRVGIIGCGNISELHLKGYKELQEKKIGDVAISAVCDAAESRGRELAGLIGTFQKDRPKIYTDFGKMLDERAIDVADICTPPFLHHTMAIACSEAGVHATVEKPFAITVKAATKMMETAGHNGTVLALSENVRRAALIRAYKWIIDEGYIGNVEAIFTGSYGIYHLGKFWKGNEITATPWRHEKLKAGAGYVLDAGSHTADIFRYINGEVEEVFGAMKRFAEVRGGEAWRFRQFEKPRLEAEEAKAVKNSVEDLALAILKFANGSLGQYATGTGGHGAASSYGTWIYGSSGCIREGEMFLDDGTKQNVLDFFKKKADRELQDKLFPKGLTDIFALEMYDFFEAVSKGLKPETDGWDGLKSIAICYAIVESAILSEPVKISDVETGQVDSYQREINEHYNI